MDAPSNTVIVYAAAPGKVAYDGRGRLSPCTGALLEEMERPGRRLMDVLGAAAAVVARETSGMPEGWQEPWLEMKPLQEPFYFVPPPEVDEGPEPVVGGGTPATNEAKDAYDTAVAENTIAAYRAVVEHFSGFYATLARRKVEELEAAALAEERRARRQALAEKLGREFSPEAVGENGWTDLHYAAALELPGLAKELVERGTEVDVRLDESGEQLGDDLKRTLRELGLGVDYWTSDGDTLLHVAVWHDAPSAARYLMEQGADVNAESSGIGWTALEVAAFRDALSVVENIVERGADVNGEPDTLAEEHFGVVSEALTIGAGQTSAAYLRRTNTGFRNGADSTDGILVSP